MDHKTPPHLYLVKPPKEAPKASGVVSLRRPVDCSPFAVLYACGGAVRAHDPAALDT